MMELSRDLWIEGSECMPYNMKCHKVSQGVTTPLFPKDKCWVFNKMKNVWNKPCSCILPSQMPKSFQCSANPPTEKCSHSVPPAAFEVKSIGHGLTREETVLNMQRNIMEFGPIFVSVLLAHEFQSWDWTKIPVYTGGPTSVAGGHVMLAVGWGTQGTFDKQAGVDYWLLRNSWSARWGVDGYCKFQRGVNLDEIEQRGIVASMPTLDFDDWAQPNCEFKYMRWQWWKANDGTVTNYTGFADFACDEDCDLDVHFSDRGNPTVDGGAAMEKSGVGGGTTTFTINLLARGFGTVQGTMAMGIIATDKAGNVGKTQASMSIPPAGS